MLVRDSLDALFCVLEHLLTGMLSIHTNQKNKVENKDSITRDRKNRQTDMTFYDLDYILLLLCILQDFFENLKPLEDRDEKSFNDYLYEKSLEIEPRGARTIPKFVS